MGTGLVERAVEEPEEKREGKGELCEGVLDGERCIRWSSVESGW